MPNDFSQSLIHENIFLCDKSVIPISIFYDILVKNDDFTFIAHVIDYVSNNIEVQNYVPLS